MDSVTTPATFAETEQTVIVALLLACSQTRFGLYYPDADVTIRWRHGKVLPVAEINRKVEAQNKRLLQEI